ncbi:MAG: SynChlorMet cassette protein ScmD [Candidatus Poribacteria bacterium]
MPNKEKPIASPSLILREEFDDWAVLFDPETGNAHGLNPIGVFVWKRLDGKHSIEDILKELKAECEDVPPEAQNDITEFVQELIKKGLAGYEV